MNLVFVSSTWHSYAKPYNLLSDESIFLDLAGDFQSHQSLN